eukprot:Clim_evm100s134 gene=Clim_evmTU100s134
MGNVTSYVTAEKMESPVYAVPVSKGKDGESDTYRNVKHQDALTTSGTLSDGSSPKTLAETWLGSTRRYKDYPCIGKRYLQADRKTYGDFEFLTYGETNELVQKFGKGIEALNLVPVEEPGDILPRKIGFYCKNRMEWFVAQMACHCTNVTVVPLYDTLGYDTIEYVVNQTKMSTILASTDKFQVLSGLDKKCPTLKNIIELPLDGEKCKGSLDGFKVFTMEQIYEAGEKLTKPTLVPAKPEDIAILSYTSGTTGMPKGVLLAHSCIIADTSALLSGDYIQFNTEDVHLSYLPLAHIFEQAIVAGLIAFGSRIGFYRGDALKLLEDIASLRPTLFPSVPRLWNRIYDKVMGGVEEQGGIKKQLFMTAYESKKYWLEYGYYTHSIWDALVFKKVGSRVGLDRVRVMVTGAAPIAPHVMEFLRIVFCCPVVEGYGQTECSAGACVTLPEDTTIGHVGGPLPCMELKLEDVPEMNYTATDKPYPRGEVCYRGANIFKGYYKMPEKTAETIDKDGWLHSGDIGELRPNGSVKIIDRKKNIFKLAQGEYVAAEKIENVFIKAPIVAQNFVYGDSLQPHLVAIIVVDPEAFPKWCSANGVDAQQPNSEATRKAVLNELTRVGKENKLHGFEIPKGVHIEVNPWTPEEEQSVMTPTFKLRRPQAKERYQKQIDDLYSKTKIAGRGGLRQGQ